MNQDHSLTLSDKLELLKNIKLRQDERKERLRFWIKERHKIPSLARIMVKSHITLIKEQDERYIVLWQSILKSN